MKKAWHYLTLLVLISISANAATTVRLKTTANEPFAVNLPEKVGLNGSYELLYGPDWITVTQKGIAFGTPLETDLGENECFIQVQQGSSRTSFQLLIEVEEISNPVLTDFNFDAVVDEIFTAELATLCGIRGDYDYRNLPGWLRGSDTGTLVGIPKKADVGEITFEASVKTDVSETVYVVKIKVADKSTNTNTIKAKVGQFFSMNLYQLIKENGRYYVRAPRWLELTTNTDLRGTPKQSDVGIHTVHVEVRRLIGSVFYEIDVEVLPAN